MVNPIGIREVFPGFSHGPSMDHLELQALEDAPIVLGHDELRFLSPETLRTCGRYASPGRMWDLGSGNETEYGWKMLEEKIEI